MDSDGSHIITGVLICAALVAARAFNTACEAACTEINDSKLKSFEGEKGSKGLLFRLLQKPSELMNAFNVWRVLSSVLFAFAALWAFYPPFFGSGAEWGRSEVILYAAAIVFFSVILLDTFGDIIPKMIVRGKDCSRFAAFCAPAVRLTKILMLPFTAAASLTARVLSVLMGSGNDRSEASVTEEEIRMMVDAGTETGSIESSEQEMINNVFEFNDMTVSDVMTHRTDIVGVDIDAEISEVVYTAMNSGFSRLPVYRGSVDRIEGMIYVKDLLCLIGTGSSEGISIKSFIRDAEFVPESCKCDDLFKKLTAEKLQLAVAVDEYGGTAGLVTMEDLVEAIVGSIQDEYDNEDEELTKISDDTFTVSGNADAADVMEALGCPLPEDSEYDTMSGFVTDLLGRIPDDGEMPSVSYENITFTVLLSEDMRIVKIKAVKNNKEKKELSENEDNN